MPAHRFSASASALAEHCLYPFRADIERPKTKRRWHANTAIHFAIEQTITTRNTECAFDEPKHPDAILSETDMELVRTTHETWLREWYEHHKHERWTPEFAIGVDPRTRSTMAVPKSHRRRDYTVLGESYVPGTADIVRYDDQTGTVYIADWKSGVSYDLTARPASENKQLATLAFAFASFYGATRAVVAIAKVRPQRVVIDEAEITRLDLEEHRQWLIDVMDRMPNAPPIDGPHCYGLYCEHYGTCPATIGALAKVEPSAADLLPSAERNIEDDPEVLPSLRPNPHHLPIVSDPNQITSAEHARYQYETLRAAQAAIDSRMAACWDAVRQWADANDGVRLDTMVWKRVTHPRESIDLATVGATNALEHVLGDAWRTAVEMSTSKAAIEKAVRPIVIECAKAGEKITIAGMKRVVLDALRTVGAVKVGTRIAYEEVELAEDSRDELTPRK